jgi:hypothetical protein
LVAAGVTAIGKIGDPVAVFIGVVNQATVLAARDNGGLVLWRGVEREREGERDCNSRREEAHFNCRWPVADSQFRQSLLPSAATKY